MKGQVGSKSLVTGSIYNPRLIMKGQVGSKSIVTASIIPCVGVL